MVSKELLSTLRHAVRVTSEKADEEINELVESCRAELKLAGVYGDEKDPLYLQAVRLYCKAHYGYDGDTDRFLHAYESLRDSMALSGDYKEKKENDSKA